MIFSLLVNPKTGKLYYARIKSNSQRTVEIYDVATDDKVGTGYFNAGDPSYSGSSHVTGFPRVHTPQGVTERGTGLGTVLYTALCHAAFLESEGELRLPGIDVSGAGISSSPESRSSSASAWWERAKKFGLVREETGEVESEPTEESFDYEGRDDDDLIRRFVSENGDDSPDELTWYRVRATYNVGGGSETVEADAYPFDNALDHHLVLATVDPASRRQDFEDLRVDDIHILDDEVLPAINFERIVAEYNESDKDADVDINTVLFRIFFEIAYAANIPPRALEDMTTRLRASAGIATTGPWMPSRPRSIPRGLQGPTPELLAAYARLEAHRKRLGWDRFVADDIL